MSQPADYDLVVIGAGPAGSSAAFHASRRGLNVLIADRVAHPRPKTCGDAVTPRALVSVRRMGISDLPGFRVRGIRVVHKTTKQQCFDPFPEGEQSEPNFGVVVGREVLDHLLLQQAQSAGATFVVGRAAELKIDRDRTARVVLAMSNGTREVHARHVVAATGSVAQTTLYPNRPSAQVWGIAGRCHLRLMQPAAGAYLEYYIPIFSGDRLCSGYGWAFPAAPDVIAVGVGIAVSGPPHGGTLAVSLRRLIDELVAWLRANDPRFVGATLCGPIRTAPIAGWPCTDLSSDLLLVGDGAGLPSPFSGEGISQALESGELAAIAIADSRENAAEHYRQLLKDAFPRTFWQRRNYVAMHDAPMFNFGRGWDLIATRTHGIAETALWQLFWDKIDPAPQGWKTSHSGSAARTLCLVHKEVFCKMSRLTPILHELLSAIAERPPISFGCYTAFAVAVLRALRGQAAAVSGTSLRALSIVEMLALVRLLHRDLRPVIGQSNPENTWGRNTSSLLMADALNVRVFSEMVSIGGALAHQLSAQAEELFLAEAAARGAQTRHSTPVAEGLLVAAAQCVLDGGSDQPIPARVRNVAQRIAQLESLTPPALMGTLLQGHDPLTAALHDAFAVLADIHPAMRQRLAS